MAEHELNKIVDDEGEVFNLRDSTKQPVADRVTTWGSTPSDTKYPSEKLVKDSLDGKLPKTTKASEIISSAYPQCFYSTSYYYGGYVLFYDVTSAFDGTFTSITSDQAHVAFSGFVQSAKYNGYGEPQFFKVEGKVNGKYPTNYNASTSKTYGPVVLKRTYEEDGVTKERYYFAIKVPPNYNYGMMFFGVFHKYGLSGTALSWDSGFLGNLVLSTDTEYSVHWSWTAGYNVAAEAGTADKAKAFDSTFTGTDSIKSALDGKVPGTALSVSVPANSTRYVKMVVPNGYHHYLVFFNASQGVLHAEWLFRSYGDGGTARTTVNYIGALVTARRWYVAGASGNTFYIEFVNNSTGSQHLNFKVCALDISALPTLTVESEVPSGYVQQPVVGTVASQLLTARNLAVSLSNTSTDTPFDGHAAVTNIKTTGTLGIGNGGTGATTARGAMYNTLGQEPILDSTLDGNSLVPIRNNEVSAANGVFRWFKLSNVWNYIKGQISSVLGLTATSYGGNAATAAGYTSGGAIDTALQGKATPADIASAIQALDVASQGGDGKYIKAIYETDGKISATAETMDTAPTANSTKAVTSGGVKTALDGKVDKVSGKGLSTNDFTTAEKNKLAGIASGAEVNVQSDWNQVTTTADDYIKNKPQNLVQDASYVHTDNNYTTEDKNKVASAVQPGDLGTAAYKDVPESGNASTTQVVLGSDSRLSDARPASDVPAWAKAATKPTYTASEVGAAEEVLSIVDNGTTAYAFKIATTSTASATNYPTVSVTAIVSIRQWTSDTSMGSPWSFEGFLELFHRRQGSGGTEVYFGRLYTITSFDGSVNKGWRVYAVRNGTETIDWYIAPHEQSQDTSFQYMSLSFFTLSKYTNGATCNIALSLRTTALSTFLTRWVSLKMAYLTSIDSNVGSATNPVYVGSDGQLTACNIEFVVNDSSIGNRIVFY